jgi:hypothetical protein
LWRDFGVGGDYITRNAEECNEKVPVLVTWNVKAEISSDEM